MPKKVHQTNLLEGTTTYYNVAGTYDVASTYNVTSTYNVAGTYHVENIART